MLPQGGQQRLETIVLPFRFPFCNHCPEPNSKGVLLSHVLTPQHPLPKPHTGGFYSSCAQPPKSAGCPGHGVVCGAAVLGHEAVSWLSSSHRNGDSDGSGESERARQSSKNIDKGRESTEVLVNVRGQCKVSTMKLFL